MDFGNLHFPLIRKFSLVSVCFLQSICSLGQDKGSDHEAWEYVLVSSGDVLQLALPITAATATLIEGDFNAAKQLAYSYGSTLVLTYSMKYIIHKKRPEGRNRFDSFPSGHTASAFSGASFIHRRYGWKYGWIAYTLAGVVGVSRMEGPDGFHDIWDVLGGAVVGIGSTYVFTLPNNHDKIDFSFASGNGSYMISFNYRF